MSISSSLALSSLPPPVPVPVYSYLHNYKYNSLRTPIYKLLLHFSSDMHSFTLETLHLFCSRPLKLRLPLLCTPASLLWVGGGNGPSYMGWDSNSSSSSSRGASHSICLHVCRFHSCCCFCFYFLHPKSVRGAAHISTARRVYLVFITKQCQDSTTSAMRIYIHT